MRVVRAVPVGATFVRSRTRALWLMMAVGAFPAFGVAAPPTSPGNPNGPQITGATVDPAGNISVSGQNLSSAAVTFGGTALTVVSNTGTALTATLPSNPMPSGTYALVATTSNGATEFDVTVGAVGPQGPAGPPGPQGPPGMTSAYSAGQSQSRFINLNAGNQTLTSLTLPVGNYVVMAHVSFIDINGSLIGWDTNCVVQDQAGTLAAGQAVSSARCSPHDYPCGLSQNLSMHGTATLSSGTTLILECAVNANNTAVTTLDAVRYGLTAIPVANIISQ
jgi:hypothetical protein